MPADYDSTARALALPISPPHSPNQSRPQAPWSRRSESHSRPLSSGHGGANFRDRTINNLERMGRTLYRTTEKMTPVQMALAVAAGLTSITLTILFLVFSEKIFAWLERIAQPWRETTGGWLILWAMTFATAFPPIIGYSTCLTLAGFVYGFPHGWPIVASATVVGSTCSFIVSRTLLSKFVGRLMAYDRRFEALSLVLKHDGLKLLVMIRLCPLPYSISNGAISTFPTVQPLMFALATLAATPKLLIAIFVGSRLAVIARSGEKMDTTTKIINWCSIVFGVSLGILTGYLIYNRTLTRSRELEAREGAPARTVVAPRGDFSDEPDEEIATAAILRDDQIDFLDVRGDMPDPNRYLDEEDDGDDDDDDDYKHFNGDEEGAIGLDKRPPHR